MKKTILSIGLILCLIPVLFAQLTNTATLFEKITNIEKKTDRFNMFLNMQGSFNTFFNDDYRTEQTAFKMDQLRLEIKGNVTDRIYYRYRQRLNKNNTAQSLDNLPFSIDYAAVGFHATDKLSILAGKQSTTFGGFEFDLNPIEVYQYCDLIDYMANFLVGVDFKYQINQEHEIHFQVQDSRNGSFEELYGKVPENIEAAKAPLGYTLNWNGSFLDNILTTRWSASIFHEASHKNWYYYALGTQVKLPKFIGFFDFMYSSEGIDRTDIISMITANDGDRTQVLDTRYMALVLNLKYRICPKINLFAKGTYETAKIHKATESLEKGKYRTSYMYIGGVSYYPTGDNLHFFLNYMGRSYDYTNKAQYFGAENNNPQRVQLGLVYQLPMF